jgi:choline dehydrogenase-like flavoprotein
MRPRSRRPSVSANTNATVLAIAERVASMLTRQYP